MKKSNMSSTEKDVFNLINAKLGLNAGSTGALRKVIHEMKNHLRQDEKELNIKISKLKTEIDVFEIGLGLQ